MTFKASDPIMGTTRGSVDICYTHAKKISADRLPEVKKYIDEIYRLGPIVGIDAYVLYVQAVHETGDFQSSWWNDRLNPAGIGITGTPSQDNQSRTWTNGTEAAKSHVAHMLMYTLGKIDRGGLTKANDPRYQAYIDAHGAVGIAEEVQDLENTWGIDDGYAEAMVRRGNEVWSAVPNAGTVVPPTDDEDDDVVDYTPKIIDRWLHVAQLGYGAVERRYIGRRGMTPKIIVVHIQEGYNLGSWQWFHETTASATVEIAHNGDIWRLVPEADAPWTNGDVNVPSAIGREVMNKWGPDPNVYTLSIENEGFSTETHTAAAWAKNKATYAKQLQSNIWQINQWMAKYRIDAVYVIRHKDISTVGKPTCPGDAFFADLHAAIGGDVPVIDVPAVYATPSVVAGFDGTKDVKVNTALFHADKKKVTVNVDELFARQYAGTTSSSTRAPLKKGESFDALGWVEGEKVDNESRWWVSSSYSRIWVGGTKEKPSVDAPVDPADSFPDTMPDGVKIFNGTMHYIAYEPNTTVARKFTVRVSDATIRDQPSTKGKALGKVKQGQELIARYYCFGEDVKGDRIWWLLDNGNDPFVNPQYIWANVSEERPE